MQRNSKERSVQTCVLEYQVGHWIDTWRPTHGVCGQRGNAYQSTSNHKTVTVHWIQKTNMSVTPLNQVEPATQRVKNTIFTHIKLYQIHREWGTHRIHDWTNHTSKSSQKNSQISTWLLSQLNSKTQVIHNLYSAFKATFHQLCKCSHSIIKVYSAVKKLLLATKCMNTVHFSSVCTICFYWKMFTFLQISISCSSNNGKYLLLD
jgi:hypothetical protein